MNRQFPSSNENLEVTKVLYIKWTHATCQSTRHSIIILVYGLKWTLYQNHSCRNTNLTMSMKIVFVLLWLVIASSKLNLNFKGVSYKELVLDLKNLAHLNGADPFGLFMSTYIAAGGHNWHYMEHGMLPKQDQSVKTKIGKVVTSWSVQNQPID